jgi:hypothetical protein
MNTEKPRMRTAFSLTAVFIVLGVSAAWSGLVERSERPSVCAADDDYMSGFLPFVRDFVSKPGAEAQESRDSMRVPRLDRESVTVVRTDSLCARAGLLMNRERHLDDSTSHQVYMARIGNRYWAEDKFQAGEWIQGLVLDSTLSRVLARPGR